MQGSLAHRLAVGNDFSVQLVHRHQGCSVGLEMDEAVGGQLAGELVVDELEE